MVMCGANGFTNGYDRYRELKSFDESKAGVKGLVDSGISKVPRMFIRPQEEIAADEKSNGSATFVIPTIDLAGIATSKSRRAEVVSEVLKAAKEGGFFQLVNHGIPKTTMEEMMAATRAFHEQPKEMKEPYYSIEQSTVNYGSNFDLYVSKYANWRDTLFCAMEPCPPDPKDLPPVCRDITLEYSKQVKALGITIFQLLSEALGLEPNFLIDLDCAKGHALLSHYYPACPEPALTLGTSGHCDPDFLTILLQDHIGGLQVRCQNQWIDVLPVPGALVVNIGDLLQLISNDLFRSVEHRVLAKRVGPRISIACFFTLYQNSTTRMYGPITELISEHNSAVYMETTVKEIVSQAYAKGLDGQSVLTRFKLQK